MIAGTWQKVTLKSAHELTPCKAKVSGENICNGIRGAYKVVMTRDVTVEALVDSKQTQQVRWDCV